MLSGEFPRRRGATVIGQAQRVRSLLEGTSTWLTTKQIAGLADCPFANVNPYLSEFRRFLDASEAARRLVRRWDKSTGAWVFRLETATMSSPPPFTSLPSRRRQALEHPGLHCSAGCGLRASVLTRTVGEHCRRRDCPGHLLEDATALPAAVVTMPVVEGP